MPTPRSPITLRTIIFISFIIMSDSEDEDTTLPFKSTSLPPFPLFEEMEQDIGISQDDIGSSQQEIVALHARVETLEQYNRVTRDSLRIARGRITLLQLRAVAAEYQAIELHESHVTNRLEITELHSRFGYAETRLERSHVRQTRKRVRIHRAEMIEQDFEALHVGAKAAEQ
uniref:Uncharacterized protein n=1 Tax=Tanacetum cinerariifolium TaxID=118510 RepID=A0A6L2P4M5_TANCI|nr:hypothetical protein [Tanacetum cinerariifolium]